MRRVLGCDVATMRARQHNQPWEAGAGGPAGAGLALAARGRRDCRNATNIECLLNGQGWHNRFLTKQTPSSIFFIYRKKTARTMRSAVVLLTGNVRHISD